VRIRTLTAIVVSRGLDGLLAHSLDCLGRALAACGREALVVVVDNASPVPYLLPATTAAGPPLDLVRFDVPCSFGRANNEGAARHPADAYLLLNNDVFLHEDAIARMVSLAERTPNLGVCGSRMVFPDGTIQHCGVVFGRGDTGPFHVDRGRPSALVSRVDREFQAVTGACMLLWREAWTEAGGLAEDYPFGLEDIDLCLRVRQSGWRVWCAQAVDSLHLEAQTPGRRELDVPSRRLFMERWRGRFTIDG